MIKRQQRLQRIANVAQEFLAAMTAAEWLQGCQEADPSFGNQPAGRPRRGSTSAKTWRQHTSSGCMPSLKRA